MIYSEKGFKIQLVQNRLDFSGKIEKADYSDVDKFLQDVDKKIITDDCIIFMNELDYLNSSGIRCIATFVMASSKRFEIHINSELTWQKTNIPVLETLKPDTVKIIQ